MANVVGALGGNTAVVENCTAAEPVVGGRYSDNKPVQAKIGNVYYGTFASAYAAAQKDGTITLLAPVVVEKDETLTLNKGVTIEYTSGVINEAMFNNKGTMIVDGDVINYTYTG